MQNIYLPPEILSCIFVGLLKLEFGDCLSLLHPSRPPLSLERVCKQWRNAVQSTPQIWTRLRLPPLPPGDIQDECISIFLCQVERWLARSGTLPLELYIHAIPSTPRVETQHSDTVNAFFGALFRHCHRWRAISLTIHQLSSFPSLKATSLPLLSSLDVHTKPNRATIDPDVLPWAAVTAPRLRVVSLEVDDFSSWALPWSQLTQLRLDNCTWFGLADSHTLMFPAFRTGLAECSSLRTLTLSLTFADSFLRWRDGDQVVLPELETLHLDVLSSTVLNMLIRTIFAPKLRVLDIRPSQKVWWNPSALISIRESVNVHGATLKELRLPEMGIKEQHHHALHLHSIIAGATHLRMLEFHISDFTTNALRSLVLHFSSGDLESGQNPMLMEICVQGDVSDPTKINLFLRLLLDVIESRWWLPQGALDVSISLVGRLAAVDLSSLETWFEKVDETTRARVRALNEEGFKFRSAGP